MKTECKELFYRLHDCFKLHPGFMFSINRLWCSFSTQTASRSSRTTFNLVFSHATGKPHPLPLPETYTLQEMKSKRFHVWCHLALFHLSRPVITPLYWFFSRPVFFCHTSTASSVFATSLHQAVIFSAEPHSASVNISLCPLLHRLLSFIITCQVVSYTWCYLQFFLG